MLKQDTMTGQDDSPMCSSELRRSARDLPLISVHGSNRPRSGLHCDAAFGTRWSLDQRANLGRARSTIHVIAPRTFVSRWFHETANLFPAFPAKPFRHTLARRASSSSFLSIADLRSKGGARRWGPTRNESSGEERDSLRSVNSLWIAGQKLTALDCIPQAEVSNRIVGPYVRELIRLRSS
jgi:hypothetical protein